MALPGAVRLRKDGVVTTTVLLPASIPLAPRLPDDVQAVTYDVEAPLPVEQAAAEVLVTWGNPDGRLRELAQQLHRLRWVQTLSAGPDQALAAGFGPDVVITSGRSLHDRPVAEHALALVLAAARRLDLAVRAQIGHRWASELLGPPGYDNQGRFSTLSGADVVVWGFGSIAQTLAPLLGALGANVVGVARSAGTRAGVRVVTREDLPALLTTADVLVLILPSTEQTRHALGADLLGRLSPHAWVVNVGRGSTVDEDALVRSLAAGRLGGAALDVMSTEPLPPGSPLWDAPNVILTPHVAGGRPVGADELIAENVRAFVAGEPLRNLVERPAG